MSGIYHVHEFCPALGLVTLLIKAAAMTIQSLLFPRIQGKGIDKKQDWGEYMARFLPQW
jgi:hypothetical protein